MIRETERSGIPGLPMLLFLLVGLGLVGWAVVGAIKDQAVVPVLAWMAVEVVLVVGLFGVFIVNPNEGRVMQLFGDYKGTVKTAGLRWANPFYSKRHISLRVRNFESGRLKVNDNDGNPIEIAAVVVWRVVDTAEAVFEVDNYENYVKVQTRGGRAQPRHPVHVRFPRGTSDVPARQHRGRGQGPAARDPGAAGQGRRAGHRGPPQPPGLRPRDRGGHAPPAAGGRDHCRAPDDRGGRGRHGGHGPGPAGRRATRSSSTRSARRPWSATCSSCCARIATRNRSSTRAPSTSRPWPSGSPSSFGSIPRCWMPSSAGPRTTCAA